MSIISETELADLNWLKRQLVKAEKVLESVNEHPLMGESFKHHVEAIKTKIKELESQQP